MEARGQDAFAAAGNILFFFTFYNCIVSMGFLPWENRVAFSRGKPARDRFALPNLQRVLGILVRP